MSRVKISGELRQQLHEFVDEVVAYAENPGSWPLTTSEQIAFIRSTIHKARQIAQSKEYIEDAVLVAAGKERKHRKKFGL